MSDPIYDVLTEYYSSSCGHVDHEIWSMAEEIVRLRAAIERVRALHSTIQTMRHGMPMQGCIRCYDEDGFCMPYPCPTLRTLDGEDV